MAATDDLPELPDLPEIPELPDDHAVVAPPEAYASATAEKPPLRQLDKAPLHLRKAALIVVVGSFLPWMGHGGGWVTSIVGKLVVLAAAWLWFKQIEHNWGPKLPGALGKLAALAYRPKAKDGDDDGKRRARARRELAPTALEHPFPTALHVLSLVCAIVGCVVLPSVDPARPNLAIAAAEIGMLAWAAYTWVHIFAYERWGKFNPIFPLMFLGMVFGGATRVVFSVGDGFGSFSASAAILGGAIVAVGGGLAAYTIVEALMQAKKEGDEKKRAALEARRAARQGRKA